MSGSPRLSLFAKVTSIAFIFPIIFACNTIPGPALLAHTVEQFFGQLTLEQKIGQRFITWIEGTEISDRTRALIGEGYVGGVILYPWNIDGSVQVRQLTSSLQKLARQNQPSIELLICADQEGGRVAAFRFRDTTKFPAPFYWARFRDPDFVEAAAYIIARELVDLGCNMNLSPVLDLYGTPDRTIIGDRAMGSQPDVVSELGIAYLKGAHRGGVISVVKHFPGHGSSVVDSHSRLPVVDLTEKYLLSHDFKPFQAAINHGAEAVMTAHVLYKDIDPDYPATLSTKILRDKLRGEFGFNGVVISDGIAMGALSRNFTVKETLKLILKAGVDVILVHTKYDLHGLKKLVKELYNQGEISDDDLDRGVRRILYLKAKYNLLKRM